METARIDKPTGRRPAQRKPLAIIGTVAAALVVILGVVWSVTRAQTTATAGIPARTASTATATATPRLVYQSDWTRGASDWKLPATAKITTSGLTLSGDSLLSIVIPYTPTTRNYTIEMDFQILGVTIGGHFGLTARNAAGDREYLGQMQCTPMHQGAWTPALGGCAGAILAVAQGGTYPSGIFTSDYVVHGGPQTFRMEVRGNTVNFCPVNDCLVPVTSASPLAAAPQLIIEDRAITLLVTRVTVIALA